MIVLFSCVILKVTTTGKGIRKSGNLVDVKCEWSLSRRNRLLHRLDEELRLEAVDVLEDVVEDGRALWSDSITLMVSFGTTCCQK